MYETAAELAKLQQLLDVSLSRSTPHLRSIVTPGERTLTAAQLVRVLTGMCTLALATVTALGEPRISGVDGHLIHGKWAFTTAGSAAKARHLRARPAVSAAHLRGDELGVSRTATRNSSSRITLTSPASRSTSPGTTAVHRRVGAQTSCTCEFSRPGWSRTRSNWRSCSPQWTTRQPTRPGGLTSRGALQWS